MKKIVIIILASMMLFATGCGCSKKNNKKDDEQTINDNVTDLTGTSLVSDQLIDGIKFTNTTFLVQNGITTFRVTLENTVTTVKKINGIVINIKDSNGTILKTLERYDFENLSKGQTFELNFAAISLDLSNAASIEYILDM